MKATIAYSVSTHESVENGDVEEHGFWLPGGWEHPLNDSRGDHPEVLVEARAGAFDIPWRDALRHAIELGATHEIQINGSEVSALSVDPPCDRAFFEEGESRAYTVLFKCKTPLRARVIADALKDGKS